MRRLLLNMGGVDKDNATGQVLQVLRHTALPPDCQITVVMGPTAPWLQQVAEQARTMPWPTQVLASVSNMAQLMAESDLAIGAAGATSWERCCLALPTVMVTLAENQLTIANNLSKSGAADLILLADLQDLAIVSLFGNLDALAEMSVRAAAVTDGLGALRVLNYLLSDNHENQCTV